MTNLGDNPIRKIEDDVLNRTSLARTFTKQVLALDSSEGVVVGILGAWGSGKTSFINLARLEFERDEIPVLDFNPWMFSGTEQLVEKFFSELSTQLKVRYNFTEVGNDLETFGEAFSGVVWLPVAGPWIERARSALRILSQLIKGQEKGIQGHREKLEQALRSLEKPIVVVLDDIDRLTTSEIRDIFKLVRLIASFPNISYILAFDRKRVEKALSEDGLAGRAYLEKILQAAIDLPFIPNEVINQEIFAAIEGAIPKFDLREPFNEEVWPNVFMEIIRPLIQNMRDIRRYASALHMTIPSLHGQIELTDVLSLEAIRVFLPDVFDLLHGSVDILTIPSENSIFEMDDDPPLAAQIDKLIQVADPPHKDLVKSMIERLFPAASQHLDGTKYGEQLVKSWIREHRVAHGEFLRLYLERVAGEGLYSFTDAKKALAYLDDKEALNKFLRSIDSSRQQDVIESLENYDNKFIPAHVIPATIVLLNLLPDLPERTRGMFDLSKSIAVSRVIISLLKCLNDPKEVKKAVSQILPNLTSLSSKLRIINIIGFREKVGLKLVSKKAANEFQKSWREEVRSTSVKDIDLTKEHDLLKVFQIMKHDADLKEDTFIVEDDVQITLFLLQSSRETIVSYGLDNRAVSHDVRLAWDSLIDIYGDEMTLKKRIKSLKESKPKNATEILILADKYLSGWRPREIGDDE
ncbi:MAG: P-loop NTPase fold protein [Candidatus Babeliales bacterium]